MVLWSAEITCSVCVCVYVCRCGELDLYLEVVELAKRRDISDLVVIQRYL